MAHLTKARKPHRCTLCGYPIPKGEGYFYERLTPWSHPENECFWSFRAHQKCESIWQTISQECDGEIPEISDFRQLLSKSV